MSQNEIKSLFKHKLKSSCFIGVVKAKHWFNHHKNLQYPVLETDSIVCKWFDFNDGEKSNIEGKETIAICRKLSDAKIIYESLKK